MPKFFATILVLIVFGPVTGQSFHPKPDWRFDNFSAQNNFVSVFTHDITVDTLGYVWTSGLGIRKFDGVKIETYNSFDTSSGIKDNYSPNILTDQYGRVWAGNGAGLCYYNDITGKFQYVSAGPQHHIDFAFAFSLQKNYLWFTCNYGLAKVNLLTLNVTFTALNNVLDGIFTFPVNDSVLWVSSRERMFSYNALNNTFKDITFTYNNAILKIWGIIKHGNQFFLGTNKGLMMLSGEKATPILVKGTENFAVNVLLFHPNDKKEEFLLLGTEGNGIKIYNTISKKIEYNFEHDEANPYSLNSNIINNIYIDKKGILWVATGIGISMVDVSDEGLRIKVLQKSNTDNLVIEKMARDKFDTTKLWFACTKLGLGRINWQTRQVENIFDKDLKRLEICDFKQVNENDWLLLTHNELIEWNPRKGVLKTIKPAPLHASQFSITLHNIIEIDAHTYFVTSNRGLYKYNLFAQTLIPVALREDNSEITSNRDLINGFFDGGKLLWITSRNGLFCYDISTKKIVVYKGTNDKKSDYTFTDVAPGRNNQVLCASTSGIALFDRQTKKFEFIHQFDNINNPVCNFITLADNIVWIASDAGLLSYNVDTHKASKENATSATIETFSTSEFIVMGKNIIFGFRSGYIYFDSSSLNSPNTSEPIIENIYVNNQPTLKPWRGIASHNKLIFTYEENSINIYFTAFEYTNPAHINFRYRLDGADKYWQHTNGQRSANYAQLSPGHYVFNVQSGSADNKWNNNSATLYFDILPPFWETWWFEALLFITILCILYILYRYRIRNILAIEHIRQGIASDFHDDLGSTLSTISIYSQVAMQKTEIDVADTKKLVEDIGARARTMMHALNDMVWAVEPGNDTLYNLMQRMVEFSQPVAEAKEIQLTFLMSEKLFKIKTDMTRRKNLFLVFKEAFNNAIKYSSANKIEVGFDVLNKKMLALKISDDGCGFDMQRISTGNGLVNMKKRVKEINGSLTIVTAKGAGTVISIVCRIA